ncbi:MAG: integrase [Methylocystis sp.]
MISEIYDAAIAAGTGRKAREAAEAMTVHENRFSKIESELAVLKWMVGFVMALLSAVALKLFLH